MLTPLAYHEGRAASTLMTDKSDEFYNRGRFCVVFPYVLLIYCWLVSLDQLPGPLASS